MGLCNLLMFAVVAGGLVSGMPGLAGGQATPKPAAAPRSDAPFHATDMSKPEAESNSAIHGKSPVAVSGPHQPSLAGLVKIELLPTSLSIAGPHYAQRLLVEGTFADGHQEELTSQASLKVSDPKVVTLDKDEFVRPSGNGEATLTATLLGHRATAPVA